jgi:hypothetical protein
VDRSIGRIGAWAGIIAFSGIFGYHLALTAIAGQRVSGTTDVTAISAYYQHGGIAALSVEQFVTLIPMMVFIVALREHLATSPWTRFLTNVALLAATAEVAVLISEVALQAALVTVAQAGGEPVGLFRLWDTLYNSGAYALEAVWVSAFGIAMRQASGFPSWLPRLSLVTATLLAINISAIWIGIPDPATLVSAVFLGAWLVAASVGLHRASSAEPVAVRQPAAA